MRPSTEQKLQELLRTMGETPGLNYEVLAERMGCTKARISQLLKASRGGLPAAKAEEQQPGQRTVATELLRKPPTLDDLVRECNVDLKRERVDRHLINKFEQGSKHPETGEITVVPLWQIKAWLSPVPGALEADVVKETIEWVRKNSPVRQAVACQKSSKLEADDPVMLEMSIPDIHVGRLTWSGDTRENYDTKIAVELHQEAVETLWHRTSILPVRKVLFAASGDIFNVDNDRNETTAGTLQQEDGRWQKSFTAGVGMLHRAIEFLRTRCPDVEVRFIGGNHDRTRLFYAGEVVKAMYANTKGVVVINDPHVRQYVRWGNVLLGLTHGDGAKQDKLPLIMASEAAEHWGLTTHREIHTGHYHSMRETRYHAGNEHNAVRVRVLPSLVTSDYWHELHGFVCQQRAAEAYAWSAVDGYLGHFSFTAPRQAKSRLN